MIIIEFNTGCEKRAGNWIELNIREPETLANRRTSHINRFEEGLRIMLRAEEREKKSKGEKVRIINYY